MATPELEREIAVLLAAGDHAAAATTALNGLGPQIVGYLGATLRDDDAAHDVFAHFCEQLWKSLPTFRGESSFKTWAYKLVLHSVGRYRRDGFRTRGRALASSEAAALAEEIHSRTAPYLRTDVKDRIAELRASLDPTDQTLLFLRVDQGLSWNEVAEVMSEEGEPVAPAALRKRFERAKERLRELAKQHGLLE